MLRNVAGDWRRVERVPLGTQVLAPHAVLRGLGRTSPTCYEVDFFLNLT